MNKEFSISFYLDKSRKNKDGKHKVRLYVNSRTLKQHKYYATIFAYTPQEFSSIWETTKPRNEYKAERLKLQALENRANEVAGSLNNFNFEDFERLLFNKTTTKQNVNYFYQKTIEKFKNKDSISTYKNYETALKCLLRFHEKPNIDFIEISVSWLEQFEKYCIEVENKSLTTVSIYLRTLKTIFNDAIADKVIPNERYPFGKRKYVIPSPRKVKKALNPKQLKILFESKPKTPEQEKAKAFWFFSYLCNGMNFKDILNLKCKDLTQDKLTFIRAKTAKTNQSRPSITVYLNDFTKDVINRYGNLDQSPNDFIFPLLNHNQNADEQYRLIKNFVRMVNQNFLKYARENGIEEKISSYWAKHSFTTMAIRKGANIEFVGEAVGHANTKTTMGYFAGFEDETKKEFAESLMDFN